MQDRGVKKASRLEWGAPTFIQLKKNGVYDFRNLNQIICGEQFSVLKIKDMLNLERFTYVPSLYLNMGYYHIELSPGDKHLCTIVLPWGKYEYKNYL